MEEDTLVADIVSQAFREGNFTAVGEEATSEEQAEGVVRLRNLVNSLFGFELGELLRDWYVPHEHDSENPLRTPLTPTSKNAPSADPYQFLPSNSRLIVKLTSDKTLYFPSTPSDGARMAYVDVGTPNDVDVTLDGNGRWIEGEASLTSDADADPDPVVFHGRKWLYRADRGEWVRLTQIDSEGRMPTPPEFDALWITGLCISLAPRYQIELQTQVLQTYADMLRRLKARYKQTEKQPDDYEAGRHFRPDWRLL